MLGDGFERWLNLLFGATSGKENCQLREVEFLWLALRFRDLERARDAQNRTVSGISSSIK
jgi:hypothetical protein